MAKRFIRRTPALLAAGLALVSQPALAADFSGSWVRDVPQSSAAPYPTYWLTRSAHTQGGGNAPFLLEVQQSSNTISARDPVHPMRVYLLDGMPHETKTDTLIVKSMVTAALVGDSINITTVQPYGGMPGNVTSRETQTWTLSVDGKILTITTIRQSPASTQTFKELFHRP